VGIFVKMFDVGKTRMIGLPYGQKNYDDTLSRFYLILERYGQTDGRTDRIAVSISRVSKNCSLVVLVVSPDVTPMYERAFLPELHNCIIY